VKQQILAYINIPTLKIQSLKSLLELHIKMVVLISQTNNFLQ